MTDQDFPITHPELTTDGISPKAVLAFLFPLILALSSSLFNWAITGNFDRVSVVLAAVGVGHAMVAALGAWLGHPGTIQATEVTPSDSLLPKAYHERMADKTPPS